MSESPKDKNVNPVEAWSIVICCVSFATGGAIFSTHSRVVGGILMGIPVFLLLISAIRAPRQEWKRLSIEIARSERKKEQIPRVGPLWFVFHRIRDVLGIVATIFLVVIVASLILR